MTLTRISIPPTTVDTGAGALLVLLNPGRMSRHWLIGMIEGARAAGIRTDAVELGQVWDVIRSGRQSDAAGFARALQEKRVRAVIGYTFNGMTEWPAVADPTGAVRPFFEQIGIPHLMWWSDHPQWASEKAALAPGLQTALRSPNHHHVLKSELAAEELRSIAGWPNCYGIPVAESPERLRPVENADPDFDVITILGSPPKLDERLERFLDEDDPDVHEINRIVADGAQIKLTALWKDRAPEHLRAELTALGEAWVEQRRDEPRTGSFRIFTRLEPQYPRASAWLRANYRVYFDALEALWDFGRWQRTFVLRYLARHLRVGVFGYDWSNVGIPGGSTWVDYDDQPMVYARGRVAINIAQCNDEEGVAHKPFQIAACGVPMIHQNRRGLESCFTPGEEVLTFNTPREAREAVISLLDDPERRSAMAAAARTRLCRDHTWQVRVPQMLQRIGLDVHDAFGVTPSPPPTAQTTAHRSSENRPPTRPMVHA